MALAKGLSIRQVLERSVDLESYTPTPHLLDWLEKCGIKHNGMLDGEEGIFPPAVIPVTQERFQRYHPPHDGIRIPKSRTEIDILFEDNQHTPDETKARLQALTNLGLFHYEFASPDSPLDCLLWHANYLPGLLHQYDALVYNWQRGVRWKKLVFLDAACSVGTDRPINHLLEVCTKRRQNKALLQDVYNSDSLYWYAPQTALVKKIWKHLPMPSAMRQVEVQWIAAPDTERPNGRRKLANTQDTLDTFEKKHDFDPLSRYGLCTCAPMALRQWLITVMFLSKHIPGFLADNLSVICARAAVPTSLWVAEREMSNVCWELGKAKSFGICF